MKVDDPAKFAPPRYIPWKCNRCTTCFLDTKARRCVYGGPYTNPKKKENNMQELNRETYDTFFDGPAVVEYWAEWCTACKAQMPMVESLAAENAAVKFGKVNISLDPTLLTQHGVRSIPFLYGKNGDKTFSHIGPITKEELQEKINSLL